MTPDFIKDLFFILRFHWLMTSSVKFELFHEKYMESDSNVFLFLNRDFKEQELYFLEVIQNHNFGRIEDQLKNALNTANS